MINEYKPYKEPLSIYTSFYLKNIYKARKQADLLPKQYCTLLQMHLIEQYTNKLITAGALRSLVPYNDKLIKRYITVLHERGFIIRVNAITPRKERTGAKANYYYTMTNLGIKTIAYFERLIKLDIKRFNESNQWNEVKPKTKSYYKQLGILNTGQSKKG